MLTPAYLKLFKGGTPARLNLLKMEANETKDKPPSLQLASWREARRYGFHNWEAAYGVLWQGNECWYSHQGPYFRYETYCDEMPGSPIKHKGRWCDPDQQSKARGIIAILPHNKCIAGYELDDSGERVYFNKVFANTYDAALMADEHARVVAEEEYAVQVRYSEAQGTQNEIECALYRLRECLALRHDKRFKARKEIPMLLKSIRSDRDRLATYSDVL